MLSAMHRREFLQVTAGSLAAASVSGAPLRPNIVVIMADDFGISDLGCYGSEIATPNIDRLAKGGVRFTQFYNTARCCPTRASLLTGLYAHQAAIGHMTSDYGKPGYRGDLSRECVTIAEALRPAGYRRAMAGKWHVTPVGASRHNWPLQRGFERYYGTIAGGGSFYTPYTLTRDNTLIEADEKNYYYTDAISENAARYIAEFSKGKAPYFLYVAYTASHWPLHAPAAAVEKYQGRYKAGWDVLRVERHTRMREMGLVDRRWPLTSRDSGVPAWTDAPNRDWQQRRMEVYAAQIDCMDRGIGRIVQAIRDSGQETDTLILFLADNGGCAEELATTYNTALVPKATHDGRPIHPGNDPAIMPGPDDTFQSYGLGWANSSNTPFRLYKHWVHEGGISSPLVAYWPRVIKQRGSVTHQPGHLIDLMATCLDAAGADYPKTYEGHPITPLEGRSLLPVLEGRKRQGHDAIYWEHEGNRAVRQGRWKLVSRFPERWELYDLEADRTEMTDLSQKHGDKAQELAGMYEGWARRANVESWSELRKPQQKKSGS
jgi:arylsulfatase